jgi:hypothetical protein
MKDQNNSLLATVAHFIYYIATSVIASPPRDLSATCAPPHLRSPFPSSARPDTDAGAGAEEGAGRGRGGGGGGEIVAEFLRRNPLLVPVAGEADSQPRS